jgi:hypothetical protein
MGTAFDWFVRGQIWFSHIFLRRDLNLTDVGLHRCCGRPSALAGPARRSGGRSYALFHLRAGKYGCNVEACN